MAHGPLVFLFDFYAWLYMNLTYVVEGRLEEMRSLVNDFILAWQCVKDQLLTTGRLFY